MRDEILWKLQQTGNDKKLAKEAKLIENTLEVYKVIYDNTLCLYQCPRSYCGESAIFSYYFFSGAKGDLIVAPEGVNYFDYLRTRSQEEDISISFVRMREDSDIETLPVFPMKLFDMLNEDGFGIHSEKKFVCIGMESYKMEQKIASAVQEGKEKVLRK